MNRLEARRGEVKDRNLKSRSRKFLKQIQGDFNVQAKLLRGSRQVVHGGQKPED